ncbi:hypothetical protein [Roseivirga sp.]|uniref:hypothetical protein n=1 Tax=Roseivirga sp. TaxID=1964215 RepID=UPI003B8B4053
MNEFNLSDKELKALLENEGLEEPSLSFNRVILEKARAADQPRSILIPLWTKLIFTVLILAPMGYVAFVGGINLGVEELNLTPSLSLDLGLDSTFQYISLLSVGVVWMAYLFNRFLNHQNQHKVKNG